jgi:hypothetical protein
MQDRRALCPCGSGRRYKSCCYAKDRARQGARSAVRAGHERIDGAIRRILPLMEAGHRVACTPGCNACCHSYVRCTPAEALVIAEWLAQPEQAAARERFLLRLPAWREGSGDLGARIDAALRAGDRRSPEAWAAYQELTLAYQRRQNLCPFNEEGRCVVYALRPTVCRSVYVLDTPEYCWPDRGRLPTTVMSPVLDEALGECGVALRHTSLTLCGDGSKRSMPDAVAAALDGAVAGS